MTRTLKRGLLSIMLLFAGTAAGCGNSVPDMTPDPALAGKAFPKVESTATQATQKPDAFPGVGQRKGP